MANLFMRCCDFDARCITGRRTFVQRSAIAIAGWIGLSRVARSAMTDELVTVMRWHADSRRLVAATESCLKVIDPDTGKVSGRIEMDPQKILDLAFDPSGRHFLIAGGDPSQRGIVELRRWPSGDLRQSHVIEGDMVTRVAWSPDGERWLEVDWNGGCRIRGVSDTATIQYGGHTRTLLAAAWASSQPCVATAGIESTIHIWNPNDGASIRRFDQHNRPIVALDFIQPDPNQDPYLVSASEDETLRLWQPKIGRLIRFARLPAIPLAIAKIGSGLTYAVALSNGQIIRVDLADTSIEPLTEASDSDRIEAIAMDEPRDVLYAMRSSGLQTLECAS